jgi:hypothetical protein
MPRGKSSRQLEFDLDAFDRDRSEFINAVKCAMERVMDAAKMGPTELQLRELVMVCARLGTLRDLHRIAAVDWSVSEWSRELRAGRTLIYKCLAVAKAAGILEGHIGQLSLCRHGVRLWLVGDLPTVEMRGQIDAAKDRQSSKRGRSRPGRPPDGQDDQSATRTDQSVSRTDQSVSRIRTSLSNNSSTGPDPDPEGRPPDGLPSGGRHSDKAPGPVPDAEAGTVIWESLPDYVLEQPEIAEAIDRDVDPLPPGELIRGVFTQLSVPDLGSSKAMTLWFRRQLSAPDPVIQGSTEGHLLLVIACGLYAQRLPEHAVRKSRVGVFVSTVCRREFRRVLKFLPAARSELDLLLEKVPHALRARDGVPCAVGGQR